MPGEASLSCHDGRALRGCTTAVHGDAPGQALAEAGAIHQADHYSSLVLVASNTSIAQTIPTDTMPVTACCDQFADRFGRTRAARRSGLPASWRGVSSSRHATSVWIRARQVGRALRECNRCEAVPCRRRWLRLKLTASVVVRHVGSARVSLDLLFKRADHALYRGPASGAFTSGWSRRGLIEFER